VIILDENIPESQWQLLRSWRIGKARSRVDEAKSRINVAPFRDLSIRSRDSENKSRDLLLQLRIGEVPGRDRVAESRDLMMPSRDFVARTLFAALLKAFGALSGRGSGFGPRVFAAEARDSISISRDLAFGSRDSNLTAGTEGEGGCCLPLVFRGWIQEPGGWLQGAGGSRQLLIQEPMLGFGRLSRGANDETSPE
jgi:hypothetical protein